MVESTTRAFASPNKYIQGFGELNNLKEYTQAFGKKASIVIDGFLFESIKETLKNQYEDTEVIYYKFGGECSYNEIDRFEAASKEADVIVGIGGGKTLDTAKAVANRLELPVIISPSAASTDAPTSAMSIIYTDEDIHDDYIIYKKNPDLVLVDTDIICKAPVRLLVAGMGDALATYFEALANEQSDTANYVGKGYRRTKMAMQISKYCYELLIAKGLEAKIAVESGCCTSAVEDIIEANILLSGLGFENTGCAGAHGIHSGLTMLPEANGYLHGEKVAFGTICQLVLENEPLTLIKEVINFCKSVGLPTTLAEMNVKNSDENIMIIAKKAIGDIASEPFKLSVEMLFNAIKVADRIGIEESKK